MNERLQGELLADVDLEAPASVHRQLGSAPRPGARRVRRRRLAARGAIGVQDRRSGALGDRGEVAQPGGDQGEAEVERLGPGPPGRPLGRLARLPVDARPRSRPSPSSASRARRASGRLPGLCSPRPRPRLEHAAPRRVGQLAPIAPRRRTPRRRREARGRRRRAGTPPLRDRPPASEPRARRSSSSPPSPSSTSRRLDRVRRRAGRTGSAGSASGRSRAAPRARR